MKSLSSVYQSVRLPLSFLKIRSLVFPDTVHDDSWPYYLVADKSRFLKKKKFDGSSFGPTDLNQTENGFFPILLSLHHTFSLK